MMERQERKKIIGIFQNIRKNISSGQQKLSVALLSRQMASLQAARNILETKLSAERYQAYEEIFSGLLLALDNTQRQNLAGEELKEISKLLADLIQYLETLLLAEKEIKKEIVFLPYQAAMWDSLESIWQAAFEDKENCNVYVIPLPYAERSQDGSAVKWHCEIDAFPAYVPVRSWREFTLEKLRAMHPDVIFIHNPYDDRNLVTSVDSQYYSDRLKTCTDKLVYVPYFVSGDKIASHLVDKPGIRNADYVIVQDENIKQQYQKNYPGEKVPEGKFLALGSPKIDKILHVKKEDCSLPEDWQRLTAGKKIILYNTSINDVINQPEKMCGKLRYVLAEFRTRTDVVLWWRPHPLMQATLKSMFPQYYAEYQQIVKQYRKEHFGIYDDSADLDRAVICSDAYYGDSSSVVYLYKATGKPIMMENLGVQSKLSADRIPVWMHNFCIAGDDVWFLHGKLNVLLKYSLRQDRLTVEHILQGENVWHDAAFCGIQYYREKIYFIPFKSSKLLVYDLKSKEEKILWEAPAFTGSLFRKSYVKDNILYAIPRDYPSILEFDMEAEKPVWQANWQETAARYMPTEKITHIWEAAWDHEGRIVLALAGSNVCLFYEPQQHGFQGCLAGEADNVYGAVACAGGLVYLWEYKKHQLLSLSLKEQSITIHPTNFQEIMIYSVDGNNFVLENVNNGNFLLMNNNLQIVCQRQGSKRENVSPLFYPYHSGVWLEHSLGGKKYYFDRNTSELNIFTENFSCEKRKFILSAEEIAKISQALKEQASGLVQETELYQAAAWLDKLPAGNRTEYQAGAGQLIYETIVKER